MKKTLILLLFLSLLLALGSCACEHAWEPASCQVPATCMLCGETQGELAAHTWVEATCIAPRTCTVCGVSEGLTSGVHAYQADVCTLCGTEKPFDARTSVLVAIASFNQTLGNNGPLVTKSYDGEVDSAKLPEWEAWFLEYCQVEVKVLFGASYGGDDIFIVILEDEADAAAVEAALKKEVSVYRKKTVVAFGEEEDTAAFWQHMLGTAPKSVKNFDTAVAALEERNYHVKSWTMEDGLRYLFGYNTGSAYAGMAGSMLAAFDKEGVPEQHYSDLDGDALSMTKDMVWVFYFANEDEANGLYDELRDVKDIFNGKIEQAFEDPEEAAADGVVRKEFVCQKQGRVIYVGTQTAMAIAQ